VTYSYTQISQYLSCPRRYKHRYLDGWKEKDTRAAMMFGRAFEQDVGAYFQRKDGLAPKDSEMLATSLAITIRPSPVAAYLSAPELRGFPRLSRTVPSSFS
jgi:PD-(D/E)XK nuclease superfamily